MYDKSALFCQVCDYVGKMNSKSVVARVHHVITWETGQNVYSLVADSCHITHVMSKPLLLLCLLPYFFHALAVAQIMMP